MAVPPRQPRTAWPPVADDLALAVDAADETVSMLAAAGSPGGDTGAAGEHEHPASARLDRHASRHAGGGDVQDRTAKDRTAPPLCVPPANTPSMIPAPTLPPGDIAGGQLDGGASCSSGLIVTRLAARPRFQYAPPLPVRPAGDGAGGDDFFEPAVAADGGARRRAARLQHQEYRRRWLGGARLRTASPI